MSNAKPKDKKFQNRELTPEQYNVCWLGGTEPPFSGKYYKTKEKGMYKCVICEQDLFSSEAKYESGSGWPAFWKGVDDGAIDIMEDYSHNMRRMEVLCSNCGAHLGHVFNDGPEPTGKRYCINSLSLNFVPEKK